MIDYFPGVENLELTSYSQDERGQFKTGSVQDLFVQNHIWRWVKLQAMCLNHHLDVISNGASILICDFVVSRQSFYWSLDQIPQFYWFVDFFTDLSHCHEVVWHRSRPFSPRHPYQLICQLHKSHLSTLGPYSSMPSLSEATWSNCVRFHRSLDSIFQITTTPCIKKITTHIFFKTPTSHCKPEPSCFW